MRRSPTQPLSLTGPAGSLPLHTDSPVELKFAMLAEGECMPGGPAAAAEKFGYSTQRYYQLRRAFNDSGLAALQDRKPGPKRNYRRTQQAAQEVIRHRYLDPEASPEVIAQKLRQCGHGISTRSVQRIIADYGLQKKTLPPLPQHPHGPN